LLLGHVLFLDILVPETLFILLVWDTSEAFNFVVLVDIGVIDSHLFSKNFVLLFERDVFV